MNFDVHPEELFDREQRGALSPEQRALLEAHVAACQVCRVERQIRADFAAQTALDGQTVPWPTLQGAVLRAQQTAERTPVSAPPAAQRRWAAAALVACLLLGTGAALAHTGLAERALSLAGSWLTSRQHEPPATHTPSRNTTQPATASAAATSARSQLARPAAPPAQAAQPQKQGAMAHSARPRAARVSTPVAAASSRVGKPLEHGASPAKLTSSQHDRGQARRAAREQASSSSGRPAPAHSTPPGPSQAAHHAAPLAEGGATLTTAGGLFEAGNRARRAGRFDEAGQLYGQLQQRFPNSAEAKLSRALLARMHLDAGQAHAAFVGFEAYLATGHAALREQAMAGRALALDKLGHSAEAERAFEAYLSAFPRSSYAPLARRRLQRD